jgi:hypothetical protein
MGDQISDKPESFAARGLRFLIGPDELIVQRDANAFTRGEKAMRAAIFSTALIVTGCIYALQLQRLGGGDPMLIVLSLAWPAIPLLWALIAIFPPSGDLRCTSGTLQVTRRVLGRARSTKTYAVCDVRRVQFVDRQFPWPSCLGLFAVGRRLTCVPGISRAQAEVVLNGLKRFGFDIAANPESPEAAAQELPHAE